MMKMSARRCCWSRDTRSSIIELSGGSSSDSLLPRCDLVAGSWRRRTSRWNEEGGRSDGCWRGVRQMRLKSPSLHRFSEYSAPSVSTARCNLRFRTLPAARSRREHNLSVPASPRSFSDPWEAQGLSHFLEARALMRSDSPLRPPWHHAEPPFPDEAPPAVVIPSVSAYGVHGQRALSPRERIRDVHRRERREHERLHGTLTQHWRRTREPPLE